MEIIYAQEELPKKVTKTVFLAGPTLRSGHPEDMHSWRNDAVEYFKELEFDGHLFIPEAKDGNYGDNYIDQVEWEEEALNMADLIIFWVPRDLEHLPGFTTNDEWGHWKSFGKTLFGAPENAEKVRYQIHYAEKNGIPVFVDLKDLCIHVVDRLGEGVERNDGETKVPSEYWLHHGFQSWYSDMQEAGNRLDDVKILWEWRIKQANNMLFSFCFWAKVWIEEEQRYKENEYIFTRTNIASCVLYKPAKDILDTDIVLVKEFRSPVSNNEGYVYEVPGGSSFKGETDTRAIILDEIEEETGVTINGDRLIEVKNRQLQSTSLSHKCFLYKVEISESELIDIIKKYDETFGNEEDTELTYVRVFKLRSVLKSDILDWSNLGMIFNAILNDEKED